jgi:hypothetical protein
MYLMRPLVKRLDNKLNKTQAIEEHKIDKLKLKSTYLFGLRLMTGLGACSCHLGRKPTKGAITQHHPKHGMHRASLGICIGAR